MPDGGTFEVSLSKSGDPDLPSEKTQSSECDEWIVWKMRDTGCGMNPQTLERAMEPFFTTKERGNGTGLGLAQVHGLVSQNGGHVHLESSVGLGTTVTIFLPVTKVSDRDVTTDTSTHGIVEKHDRVLLVEDHDTVRLATGRMLEKMNFDVVSATNGDEGWDLYKNMASDLDVALVDAVLPGLNGIDLCKRIHASRPELPIVATSGYADRRPRSLDRHGIDVWLEKPFTAEELLSAVDNAKAKHLFHQTDSVRS